MSAEGLKRKSLLLTDDQLPDTVICVNDLVAIERN
jgi:hypothetical protein